MRVFCKIPPGRKKNFLIGTKTYNFLPLPARGEEGYGEERQEPFGPGGTAGADGESWPAPEVNDAVKLAYLPEEERDAIGRLDLSALTEFRRSGAGTVEMKFTDRMRALERLLELSGPSGEEQLERFLQRMEEPEA